MYVMEYHIIGVQENELLLFTSSPTSSTRAYAFKISWGKVILWALEGTKQK